MTKKQLKYTVAHRIWNRVQAIDGQDSRERNLLTIRAVSKGTAFWIRPLYQAYRLQ